MYTTLAATKAYLYAVAGSTDKGNRDPKVRLFFFSCFFTPISLYYCVHLSLYVNVHCIIIIDHCIYLSFQIYFFIFYSWFLACAAGLCGCDFIRCREGHRHGRRCHSMSWYANTTKHIRSTSITNTLQIHFYTLIYARTHVYHCTHITLSMRQPSHVLSHFQAEMDTSTSIPPAGCGATRSCTRLALAQAKSAG